MRTDRFTVKAQEAIAAAAQGPALRAELEVVYDAPIRRGNFEEFKHPCLSGDLNFIPKLKELQ